MVDLVTLITGTPGASKTLWMISYVRELAKRENRPVYAWGIDGLKADVLGWEVLEDFREWYRLPEGSIVLFDEAWKCFKPQPPGSEVPPYIQAFAELRHRGQSAFMTTQHATQIHTFVRKMCTHHVHLKRMWGMERAACFEWGELADPNDYGAKQRAKVSTFVYPREVYGLYKSAEVHTVRRAVPWKKLLPIPLGIGALVGIGFFVWSVLDPRDEVEAVRAEAVELRGESAQVVAGKPLEILKDRGRPPEGRPGLWDLDVWRPEVAGMEMSAMFYDGLIVPVTFPKIAGCGSMHIDGKLAWCRCNSQQGTRLHMSDAQCLYYLENGWFDWSKPDEMRDGEAVAESRQEPVGLGGIGDGF